MNNTRIAVFLVTSPPKKRNQVIKKWFVPEANVSKNYSSPHEKKNSPTTALSKQKVMALRIGQEEKNIFLKKIVGFLRK